jgi:SagB-type dehydrogenase family enzyme
LLGHSRFLLNRRSEAYHWPRGVVMDEQHEAIVLHYHEETKHNFGRYARSLGYLDWANQPNPFRYYHGAPVIRLKHKRPESGLRYDQLYDAASNKGEPLTSDNLGEFLRYSLGLSAWKQYGSSRWSLRVNPSSGNLHPTEGYIILGSMPSWQEQAGVYHYVSEKHLLEIRCRLPADLWEQFSAGLPLGSFVVGLSSIHWREAWKYGERAFRYCQLDTGHALAALRFAAALFGWRLQLLWQWSHENIAAVLGLDRVDDFVEREREEPDLLALVSPGRFATIGGPQPAIEFIDQFRSCEWLGKANKLSRGQVDWDLIDEVTLATRSQRPVTVPVYDSASEASPAPMENRPELDAREIILQRRSALDFDGRSNMSLEDFIRNIRRLLPGPHAPWDTLWWKPFIHLVFFVHRVTGLERGLYFLVRREEAETIIRSSTRREFLWERPPGIPEEIPFYLLMRGDYRDLAARVSCNQSIAGDSYFSLGMIAELSTSIRQYGSSFYRNLHWEAGLIGQVLYLEAEAAGSRSTGMGCYFDDPVHEVLGLEGSQLQDLYHFTVGMAVEDPRLTTLRAYPEE